MSITSGPRIRSPSGPPPNDILAGRDQRAGGTWLGLDRTRRFGVVTQFPRAAAAAPFGALRAAGSSRTS